MLYIHLFLSVPNSIFSPAMRILHTMVYFMVTCHPGDVISVGVHGVYGACGLSWLNISQGTNISAIGWSKIRTPNNIFILQWEYFTECFILWLQTCHPGDVVISVSVYGVHGVYGSSWPNISQEQTYQSWSNWLIMHLRLCTPFV